MGLSQAQRAMVEKVRALGAGGQGVVLTEGACSYLVAVIAADLELEESFPELVGELPPFFGEGPVGALEVADVAFLPMLERLVELVPDADSYFECLAKLHKARLKYERVLEAQPIPSMEQVGPRGLLEFGKLSPHALGAYLFWRKWLFDVDNRAAQETGYLFEPIIAGAIGGFSASAKKSPIRRQDDASKGRQVDCIKGNVLRSCALLPKLTALADERGCDARRTEVDGHVIDLHGLGGGASNRIVGPRSRRRRCAKYLRACKTKCLCVGGKVFGPRSTDSSVPAPITRVPRQPPSMDWLAEPTRRRARDEDAMCILHVAQLCPHGRQRRSEQPDCSTPRRRR